MVINVRRVNVFPWQTPELTDNNVDLFWLNRVFTINIIELVAESNFYNYFRYKDDLQLCFDDKVPKCWSNIVYLTTLATTEGTVVFVCDAVANGKGRGMFLFHFI